MSGLLLTRRRIMPNDVVVMRNLIERLEKKGWQKADIAKAVNSIKNAKQNKSKGIIFLEERMYWILLVIIIAANFAISMAMIPILMALSQMLLYFAIIILGISFGLLFELVIRSIEHLEKKHHTFLAFFIPVSAFFIVLLMAGISNSLMATLGLRNFHSRIAIALSYAASFAAPFLFYRFVLKKGYYAE